jgi:multidrug resistance efflux pump
MHGCQRERAVAARAVVAGLRAGARRDAVDVARGRFAALDAQIAALDHDRAETRLVTPATGIVTAPLVEPGEFVAGKLRPYGLVGMVDVLR